jgi:putative transposase
MPEHFHLNRLERVWIHNAVYFVTTCTHHRSPILTRGDAVPILHAEWKDASSRHGWLIGRYVIMPDHVHFFCAEKPGGATRPLSVFMNKWKEWTAKKLAGAGIESPPVWQKQFFDHVLRSDESYAEKWTYVRENPVRAGLVTRWEHWPHRGFIDFDEPRGS